MRECEPKLLHQIHIDGYQIFRNDRNLDGGGVAFYVKDSLTDVKVKLKSDELELLCLEITPRNAKGMFLLNWYRPPTPDTDKTSFDSLREILRQLEREDKEIILCGDTNCDFMDPKNKNTKLLKQLYNEYQLEQLIKDHTRVAVRATKESEHHTSKTLIDHFSTNKPRYILSSGVVKSGMVDHYMIYAIRKVNAWRIRSKK